jgi:two-component system, sensor histidine kinase
LVRTLADLHGGSVSAASDGPGRGSRFEVTLPATSVAAPAIDADALDGSLDLAEQAAGAGRIVIIDDNIDLRETLAELLGLVGYTVVEAGDGPQGFTRIMAARPDAALSTLGSRDSTGTSWPGGCAARSAATSCSSP